MKNRLQTYSEIGLIHRRSDSMVSASVFGQDQGVGAVLTLVATYVCRICTTFRLGF